MAHEVREGQRLGVKVEAPGPVFTVHRRWLVFALGQDTGPGGRRTTTGGEAL